MSINEEKEVKEQKENIGIENEEKRNTGKWVKFKDIVIKIICSIAVIVILISIYKPIILKTHGYTYIDCMPKVSLNPNSRKPMGCDEELRILRIKDSIYYVIPTIVILILYNKLMFKLKIYKTKKDICYSVFIFIFTIRYCIGEITAGYRIIW